jgi:hypothetical protein
MTFGECADAMAMRRLVIPLSPWGYILAMRGARPGGEVAIMSRAPERLIPVILQRVHNLIAHSG